jgi:hypothetical protein
MRTRFDKMMLCAAYVYIVLPYIIFAVGWLKWYYAALISLVVIISSLLSLRNHTDLKQADLRKHAKKIGVAIVVILAWVYFSGIGGYSYQQGDHNYRNAIFRDLISHKWPVLYNVNWLGDNSTTYMMTYYIGYWLPSVVVGKLFGAGVADLALYLWSVIGVGLVYYFICRLLNRATLMALLVFIFFGTLYIFGDFARLPIKTVLLSDYFLWAEGMVMAGSATGLLYEVFNQSVVPWLILLLIMNNMPKQNIFFIYFFCFFQGPFAFIGLFPFVVYFSCKDLFDEGGINVVKKLFSFFSFQNIVGATFVFLPVYLYLSANSSAQHFALLHLNKFKYVQFVILSFGILAAILFPKYRKEPLYYISIAIMCIVPFFQLGHGMDLCGRVSIPATIVVTILVIRFLLEERGNKLRPVLIIYVLLSAIEPIGTITRSVIFTVGSHIEPERTKLFLYNRALGYPLWTKEYVNTIPEDLRNNNYLINDELKVVDNPKNKEIKNFIGNADKSFFYKNFVRHDQ